MFSGTFSGPLRERPLRSANARGPAPPLSRLVRSVGLRLRFGDRHARRFDSTAPSNHSLSFLPPSCRRARAGQGRSLPPLRYVQLRALRWRKASL